MKKFAISKATVWVYPGHAAWHFVNISPNAGNKIKKAYAKPRRGWGSIPVAVTLGTTTWSTSIFPDGKTGSYLLPLKKDVRKKEGVVEGDKISFELKLQ